MILSLLLGGVNHHFIILCTYWFSITTIKNTSVTRQKIQNCKSVQILFSGGVSVIGRRDYVWLCPHTCCFLKKFRICIIVSYIYDLCISNMGGYETNAFIRIYQDTLRYFSPTLSTWVFSHTYCHLNNWENYAQPS